MNIIYRFTDIFKKTKNKNNNGNNNWFFNIFSKQEEEDYLDILYSVLEKEGYANNFGKGHIYVCPNNHIYIIGNCGNAQEASICPECGTLIGGTEGSLNKGNRIAADITEKLKNKFSLK